MKRFSGTHISSATPDDPNSDLDAQRVSEPDLPIFSRSRYSGAVLFNAITFLLPAIHGTLAKLWIANIDSSMVATTDIYTYIGVVAEVLNEGLPRVAYLVIGNKSTQSVRARIQFSNTLIVVQMLLGLIMSVIFVSCATNFADVFVPEPIRKVSITYVRIASFTCLTSATEVAVAAATRALDKPDVPLAISAVRTTVNIVLEMLFLSTFRVWRRTPPTPNMQAWIRLVCEAAAALTGLAFYLVKSRRLVVGARSEEDQGPPTGPSMNALLTLAKPGVFTFLESAMRNAIYLWLISGVIKMGLTYATAWGVFNTIRWGLVMVPVMSLEASSATFVGHRWGAWKQIVGVAGARDPGKAKATNRDLWFICRPAFLSICLVLVVEIPLLLFFTFFAIQPFAYYISASDDVAVVVKKMWRTIDWCYIFYGVSTQLSAILIATRPGMYWWKSFISNLIWDFPWAIAVSRIPGINENNAWKWHAIIFGGSLVQGFFVTVAMVGLWGWLLRRGKVVFGLTALE
ncbi:hypothetical protein BDZ91DRAFT_670961 [Kalaharituber pfeilii]|nr:hypothetical protein BDZ91DRAFT_670961 [Kalaharituber pfeilii]